MKDNFFLLDTNIMVYAFDSSERIKQRIASGIIEDVIRGKIKIALSVQNLAEFFFVATKKIEAPLSIEDAQKIIDRFVKLGSIQKICYTEKTLLSALELLKKHNLHIWDALLIATMLENGVYAIYTENEKDFGRVKQINVMNPFKKDS
ncbi:MAG TPA: PIN domain-containing protein [Candidatus Nanoarchaeia archaeon]|nr:PIN domain-containing protein [Candidatus Nanoarchaeia archaeon]